MKSVPIAPIDRHMYRELAKMTNSSKLRMVYAKAHARAYLREKKKAAFADAAV